MLQCKILVFMDVLQIESVAAQHPARLRERLGADAPPRLTALGNPDLLVLPKAALFCSARSPGQVILRAYDQAATWPDSGPHGTFFTTRPPLELAARFPPPKMRKKKS